MVVKSERLVSMDIVALAPEQQLRFGRARCAYVHTCKQHIGSRPLALPSAGSVSLPRAPSYASLVAA
eukprot:11194155-Lingulodinium_polyedra.AAC.1